MAPAPLTPRILIIEDDRLFRTLAVRIFQACEPGACCLEAEDLASGLEHLEAPGLDLVLLDLHLPDCRGLDSLLQIRKRNREVAVLVVTSETDEEIALEALRCGAQDFLVKDALNPANLARAARYARERMGMEVRLRKSEALFLAISDNVVDLLAVLTPDGRRILTSASYARCLGYSIDELARIPMAELVHPEDLDPIMEALANLFTQEDASGIEYRLRHRDGTYRVMESRGNRFQSTHEEGFLALVVARDVTEQRQIAKERAELEAQLHQAQKMESLGQLASGIAHEINSPIQFVNLNLNFMNKTFQKVNGLLALYEEAARDLGPVPLARLKAAEEEADLAYLQEELPKVLQDSLDGVQRVAHIVRAMKEFTHPSNGEATMLDLNRLASSAATITRNEWKYVADLKLDLQDNLPAVLGFGAELSQVFLNLITNAAHAIAATKDEKGLGTITVSTRAFEEEVDLCVQDTGGGILPEHQAKVFDPFFTTKGVGQGTGQGLTICYQTVVKLHGGRIFFHTHPGQGTIFTVRLPLARNLV